MRAMTGFGAVVDRAKHIAHAFGVDGVGFEAQIERAAHPVDVGAAAEHFAFAGQDDGADVVGGRDAREDIVQLGDDVGIEGVAHVGAGERDARDAVGEREGDRVFSHAPLRFSLRSNRAWEAFYA